MGARPVKRRVPFILVAAYVLGMVAASILINQFGRSLSPLGTVAASIGVLLAFVWPMLIEPVRKVLLHH